MTNRIPRRNTRQRQVLLEELCKLKTHPTAGQLHVLARRRLPRISLGTVYRNLELLAEAGTIRKLQLGTSEARFDGDVTNHHHVRCIHCGRVGDVFGAATGLDVDDEVMGSPGGFRILGWELTYTGLCPDCGEDRSRDGGKGACGQGK